MLQNMQNQKLSNEQMKEIAGGSWGQSYFVDLQNAFERKIPGFEKMDPMETETAVYCLQNWDGVVNKLKDMFAGYGITMTYNGKPNEDNVYTYKGKQISIDQAWQIIDGK